MRAVGPRGGQDLGLVFRRQEGRQTAHGTGQVVQVGMGIVQAEVSANGQVTYGVIMRADIRAVPGRELTSIKTFAELDKEEKEAAEKEKARRTDD